VGTLAEPIAAEPDSWHELHLLLDQQLSGLPDRYRAVIVLCDLEGKTRQEVAGQLGVPEGTVAGWLARGRTMLAKRLRRQGLVISGSALAAVLAQKTASASVPTSVVSSTIKAVALAPVGQAVASGTVSVQVTALAEGVLKRMLLSKLKIASAFLVVIVTLSGAAGLIYTAQPAQRSKGERADSAAAAQAAKAEDPRSKAYRVLVLEWCKDEAAGKIDKKLRWNYFYPRFKKFADENPDDFAGFDSLCWIVGHGKVDSPEFAKALALLSGHHAKGTRADFLLRWLNAPRYFAAASEGIEGLLREIMTTNSEPAIRAGACFCLSQFLFNKADFARVLRRPEAADLARRVGDSWGQDYLTHLRKVDAEKLDREASGLLVLGRATYARYWANHATLGKHAPETRGKDLEGKFMALSDYRGKVVAVTFWAPWCVPCMAAIPEERARVQRMAGQPFVMLGVCGKADPSLILKTVQDKHINWRSWPDADPERKGSQLCADWNVYGWGQSFILDQQGVIRYMDLGGTDMDFAVDAMLMALKESKATGQGRPANEGVRR
jgi:peroxiredoxin